MATGIKGQAFCTDCPWIGTLQSDAVSAQIDLATHVQTQQHLLAIAPMLTWPKPTLYSPITMAVTNRNAGGLSLDPLKDYILDFTEVITTVGGVVCKGGKNIVVQGAEVHHDHWNDNPTTSTDDVQRERLNRAFYFNGFKATLHLEGALATGVISDFINTDVRTAGTIAQVQNCRVDFISGAYAINHADMFQTWGGPQKLRVDRLTGTSDYQGFMLDPADNNMNPPGPTFTEFDLRHVNMTGRKGTGTNKGAHYLIYMASGLIKPVCNGVYIDMSATSWPNETGFWYDKAGNRPLLPGMYNGRPSGGDFVSTGVAGLNYQSPLPV